MSEYDVAIVLKARDLASPTVTRVSGESVRQLDKVRGAMERVGASARSLVSSFSFMSAGVGLSLAGITRQLAGFDTAMADVGKMVGKRLGDMDAEFRGVKAASQAAGTGLRDTAAGMYQVKSAFPTAGTRELNTLLGVTSKAAKTAHMDMGEMARALAALGQPYGATADQIGLFADKLFKVEELSMVKVQELAPQMGRVAENAKAAGVSVDEFLGGLAVLTSKGMPVEQAITGMRSVINQIINPAEQAAEAAKAMGLNFSAAGIKAAGGLGGMLRQISKATKGDPDILTQVLPERESLTAALSLTTPENVKTFDANVKALANSQGTLAKQFQIVSEGLGAKLEGLKAAGERLIVTLTGDLKPYLVQAIDALTKLTDALTGAAENPMTRNVALGVGLAGAGVGAYRLGKGVVGAARGAGALLRGGAAAAGGMGIGEVVGGAAGGSLVPMGGAQLLRLLQGGAGVAAAGGRGAAVVGGSEALWLEGLAKARGGALGSRALALAGRAGATAAPGMIGAGGAGAQALGVLTGPIGIGAAVVGGIGYAGIKAWEDITSSQQAIQGLKLDRERVLLRGTRLQSIVEDETKPMEQRYRALQELRSVQAESNQLWDGVTKDLPDYLHHANVMGITGRVEQQGGHLARINSPEYMAERAAGDQWFAQWSAQQQQAQQMGNWQAMQQATNAAIGPGACCWAQQMGNWQAMQQAGAVGPNVTVASGGEGGAEGNFTIKIELPEGTQIANRKELEELMRQFAEQATAVQARVGGAA